VQDEYLKAVQTSSDALFARAADVIAGIAEPTPADGSSDMVTGRCQIVYRRSANTVPLVSFVIPTYNRDVLLVEAAESACRQLTGTTEIIIVNDGGTEISGDALSRLAALDTPLTIVNHDCRRGLGAARNTGAALAGGHWLMMLDDDDTLVAGGAERLLRSAGDDPAASFVFGDHFRQWYDSDQRADLELRSPGGERPDNLHLENSVVCGSFLVRRTLFTALHGYREDLPVHEDYNLHLRIMSSTRVMHVPVPVCVYHCRQTIPRLNHRRLYWFATCAFNHAVHRSLFGIPRDHVVKTEQREYQYAHLSRAIREGCPIEAARDLIVRWWAFLRERNLADELSLDYAVASRVCPSVL